ncbi:MAG: hypothetical protein AB8C84_11665 [Oligoflexales bacterium]
MLNIFVSFLLLIVIGCGGSQSRSSYVEKSIFPSSDQEKAKTENLVYLSIDMADKPSKDLSLAMSGLEDHVVFLVKVNDVDFEINQEESLLLNRGSSVGVKQGDASRASDSTVLKPVRVSPEKKDHSSVETLSHSKSDVTLKQEQTIKQNNGLFSKLFPSPANETQIENKVDPGLVLNEGQVVYQGVYLPNSGVLRNRLLKGFEAPRFEVNEKGEGTYDSEVNDPHLYTTASLKVVTAVLQSEADKGGAPRQTGLAEQVVFKLKVKQSQGVERGGNQQDPKQKLKLVDVYGKISPDQILGYYHVRNGDIVGEFQKNVYTSKTKRVVTKIRDGLDKFILDVSSGSDLPTSKGTDWGRFDPHIPGTFIRLSRLKPKNY